jgi:nucleoside 2-deoxyribosyltransferase
MACAEANFEAGKVATGKRKRFIKTPTGRRPNEMIAFVASAFDRTDVDAIYDKVIKRVLRDMKIRCTRVDRVEHNDDIDDKIFALMNAADFCIADLTYARPSVYYEAGFMFGCNKPVVYICRRDHFGANASDPYGNLRVHFDLQMKNIIAWTAPTNAFVSKLKRRISKVVAPMLKAREARQEELRHEQAFANESISIQLALLRRFAGEMFKAKGYSEREDRGREIDYRPRRLLSVTRNRRRIHQAINFIPIERLTKSQAPPEWALSFYTAPDKAKVQQVERLFVYGTLKKISDAAVRSIFDRFTPVDPYILGRRLDPPLVKLKPEPPTILRVGVLSGMRSVQQFREQLNSLLKRVRFD